MFEMMRNGNGMFSIGNIKPLNMMVGRNMPTSEMNIAVCCDSAPEEINKPKASETSVNKMLSATSNGMLPLIGTSSTNTLNNNILLIFTIERIK